LVFQEAAMGKAALVVVAEAVPAVAVPVGPEDVEQMANRMQEQLQYHFSTQEIPPKYRQLRHSRALPQHQFLQL
jgi:hypothetical protein